ncbi:MAG: DHA2 family efflux MFS transporter permease subunit [Candidatus Binataceae bacterium]|jgi:DHA2 family multidrug resistance protein
MAAVPKASRRTPQPAFPSNRWVVALVVTMATFMELLDTSIANVSLPHIAGGLGTSYDEATWVLTSYLVSNAIVLPMSAWLSRVFGRKRYYMMCVGLFTITSFLCGIAPSLPILLMARVLQGIGGGGLAPVEQAILVDTFPPEERASAFGLYSMAIVIAPAIGPPLGGWITDNFSWRWVFFINIPIGIISMVLSSRLVQDPPAFAAEVKAARRSGKLKIDYIGIGLIALGLGCLEVVLDRGQEDDWFGSHVITTFFIIAAIGLTLAIWWEWRNRDPVVELRLMRDRNFAIGCGMFFLFGFLIFGSTALIPEMLQSIYGYDATKAGLVLMPGALVAAGMAPIVARLVRKISPKALAAFAFVILAASMWHFARLNLNASFRIEAWARVFQGFALAFLFIPVSQIAYSYLPADKNNKASSIMNLFRNLGGDFGISFVTTMLARREQYHQQVLVSHLSAADAPVRDMITSLGSYLANHGVSSADGIKQAYGEMANALSQQAAMLSFLDCFYLLAIVAIIGLPLALMVKRFKAGAAPAGAH